MTWFVKRDGGGNITAVFANRQDSATEELAADNADVAAFVSASLPHFIDGAVFLSRVTDQEYSAIIAASQSSVAIARWIELLRIRGSVNLNDTVSRDAKAGLVAAGLLTQDRANVIFA